MSTESFADLGVSNAVVGALSERGSPLRSRSSSAVIGDVDRWPRRDREVADGFGQDARLRDSDGRPHRRRRPRPAALVLAPTRELATQIVEEIRGIAHARALRVTAVYGGAGLVSRQRTPPRRTCWSRPPDGSRICSHAERLRSTTIRMLVLDEADRMLDMGFRPRSTASSRACPHERQTLFFSATLDGDAGRIAERYARDPVICKHGPSERRANAEIEHRFVTCRQRVPRRGARR